MRKDEGEVAALRREEGKRLFGAIPGGADVGLKPATELESVKLGLIQKQTQKLFSIHFSKPHGLKRVQSKMARTAKKVQDRDQSGEWFNVCNVKGSGVSFFGDEKRWKGLSA
jgi:hypothetical protein